MAKAPQDHRAKATAEAAPDVAEQTFTFAATAGGTEFESAPIASVITPGFIRRNRRSSELDLFFSMLELLYADQPDAIAALDEMDWETLKQTTDALSIVMQNALGASLGE